MVDWEDIEEFDDSGLDDRRRLFAHLDWVINTPIAGRFVDQIVEAIELAAAGKTEEWIEVDARRHQVHEVVEIWELEELVELAKADRFEPRRGERSWRLDPPVGWKPS
ncbi:MAG: hypothetical protein GEU88_15605 [Solirubrobacterales bacterium]|nr:hypothetical protein [Solirubrobacterales bacterium]